ncbi:zinc-dependent metalloprotease [Portibacter lacus]|nr:zinc-dependent metalloprotease [Portibacter lacus]
MKYLHSILLFIFTASVSFGQMIKPVDLVASQQGQFTFVDILSVDNTQRSTKEFTKLKDFQLLSLDATTLNNAMRSGTQAIELRVPINEKSELTLELVKVNLFADDFVAQEQPSGRVIENGFGTHFRGIIKGFPRSLVSISVYEDEIAGFIAHPKYDGNFVLGKLKEKQLKSSTHIIYLDTDMSFEQSMACATTDEGEAYTEADLAPSSNRALTDCVRLLLEVDYNLHQELGNSTTASNNYLNTLFNQISTIYAGESINTVLSQSFVWTSSSPYSGSSTSAKLSSYQNNRNNFNADFAQLLTFANIGGLAATINGVCKTENSRMCVSGVVNQLETVPTFSFDVEIACHEYGHLFGSYHTHGCYWNGNNTQIDDCGNVAVANQGNTPEGNACFNSNNPVYPNNGGTVMSYCYAISGVGVNFSNGFGTQPGNAIRNRVANGTCLQSCSTGGGCTENELDLTIVTDQYPGETTWTVKNSGGTTVASGGSYSGANTTYTESICIPDGCYTFTINDSYGDGICCSYGNGSYTLRGSDGSVIQTGGNFGSSETTSFCEGGGTPGGSCVEIDFDDYSVVAYGNGQDNGTATILANGDGVSIFNNAWKSISLNYTVTANTKISFEFGSTTQGEIHGLGFDTDAGISSGYTFQLYGTQNWGNRDFDYTSPGNWQAFEIPVGQYYTGTFNRLFFAADHDGGSRNGNTYVRYIKIYEGSSCAASQGAEDVAVRNGFTPMVDGLPDGYIMERMQVYPNPASNFVNVSIQSKENRNGDLELYNMIGQKISIQSIQIEEGQNTFKIATDQLTSGTYFVKLRGGEMDDVEKITIAN